MRDFLKISIQWQQCKIFTKMYAKNLIDGIKSTSQKSTNSVVTEKTKGTATGSLIGGGIGLMFAYQRRTNLIMGAFLGALAGGFITRMFIDKQFSNK